MKIPDGVNQKTLSVEAIKDKKCLILRCNKVQWIAWIIKNESYYLGYNYRCSKHINKVIPVNHSCLNRSVHRFNLFFTCNLQLKAHLLKIDNRTPINVKKHRSFFDDQFSLISFIFGQLSVYRLKQFLEHHWYIRRPLIKRKSNIICKHNCISIVIKGRQTNYFQRHGPSEMT